MLLLPFLPSRHKCSVVCFFDIVVLVFNCSTVAGLNGVSVPQQVSQHAMEHVTTTHLGHHVSL